MDQRERSRRLLACALAAAGAWLAPACQRTPDATAPLAGRELVFAERGGFVAVEAEHFAAQRHTERRAWHVVTAARHPRVEPDADGPHVAGASGGAYLELLPDARSTHYQPIIVGESFTNDGGAMAVLSYRVRFATPGRYYVWVRCYSTGGEDNGLHAGLNGTWPESGLRWQTAQKNRWAWDSLQRTDAMPRGEPHKLFLDVPAAGDHTVEFSMREDGFEFDRWIMTTDRAFAPPADGGPPSLVAAGTPPPPFAVPPDYRDPAAAASTAHDGTGLAMPEGDFRPGGTITLVVQAPAGARADDAVTAEFKHESGTPVVSSAALLAEGRWRAPFQPDRAGQWYFTVNYRRAGQPVAGHDRLSGVFPVTAR